MDQSVQMSSDVPASATRWRRRRHWYVAVAVVGVVGLAVWWFGLRGDGDASATTTTTRELVTVTRGPLTDSVTAAGTAEAASTDDLSFGAAGTVTAVNVAAGDTVVAGQVLATLDSADLEADLEAARSELADAEATLAADESSGASDTQIAVDETRVQTAADAVADAEAALAGASLIATFDGTVASVNVTVGEELGSSGTGGTSQTGSASGSGGSSSTLGSGSSNAAPTETGGTGTSSTPDIEVLSTGGYSATLMIDSTDIERIAVGAEVTVSVSTGSTGGLPGGFSGGGFPGGGFPGGGAGGAASAGGDDSGNAGGGSSDSAPVTGADAIGMVMEVGRVADASSGVAQYPVTILFATDDASFTVGTSITAAIAVAVKDDVVQVPVRAVTTEDGTPTVVVAVDGDAEGRTETRTVTTGESAGGQIEITDGLQDGEQVVVVTTVVTGGTGGDGQQRGGSGGGQFPGGFQPPDGFQPPGGAQVGP